MKVQDFIPRKKSGKHKERRQKEEGKKDLRKMSWFLCCHDSLACLGKI